MKVIYYKEEERIVLKIAQEESYDSQIICMDHYDYAADSPSRHFWIDESIPLDIATKIFQRFHQIDQDAELEFIARALNDALNSELVVYAESKNEGHPFRDACILYQKGEFKFKNIMLMIDDTELLNKRISNIKHNITEDRVEYFIDDKLKGWLPIVRKEIAS